MLGKRGHAVVVVAIVAFARRIADHADQPLARAISGQVGRASRILAGVMKLVALRRSARASPISLRPASIRTWHPCGRPRPDARQSGFGRKRHAPRCARLLDRPVLASDSSTKLTIESLRGGDVLPKYSRTGDLLGSRAGRPSHARLAKLIQIGRSRDLCRRTAWASLLALGPRRRARGSRRNALSEKLGALGLGIVAQQRDRARSLECVPRADASTT